uniref:Uncharacterized protein n=1 Tax=Heterorhabditis bacteriophora TaxID=37862 RepID=A0A1I7W9Z5_HETBA
MPFLQLQYNSRLATHIYYFFKSC